MFGGGGKEDDVEGAELRGCDRVAVKNKGWGPFGWLD